jgi:protein gp37
MAKRLQKMPATAEKYRNGFEFTYHPRELTNFYYDLSRAKKPKKIFVNSMSDTFHENAKPEDIAALFDAMNDLPQHTFQILTKRPQNIPEKLTWTKNIQLGVTVCVDSEKWKIEKLLSVPAKFYLLSIEPMLSNIHLTEKINPSVGNLHIWPCYEPMLFGLDLVIVGGESGPGARPMHPYWVRSVRDQCAAAGVPFLFKQWGSWCYPAQMPEDVYDEYDRNIGFSGHSDYNRPFRRNDRRFGRLLDGKTHNGGMEVCDHTRN